ncbi:MAG: class I SAM-dependent methyltransferase [Betaproteobacteria bacterium]
MRWLALLLAACCALAAAQALEGNEPVVGQPGKDVVWVPSPQSVVEKMLTMASVRAEDTVVDLGWGEGRMVIAAAKRGARALGIEYNPDLVEYARRAAEREGVARRARFVQGDIFQSDFSEATVVTMFLTSDVILKLQPKLLALRPGTRIVSNTFPAVGWEPDATADEPLMGDCDIWCSALLWIVPANVAGTYQTPRGQVVLNQKNQVLTGVLRSGGLMLPLEGRVAGEEISFHAGGLHYRGRVSGGRLELR